MNVQEYILSGIVESYVLGTRFAGRQSLSLNVCALHTVKSVLRVMHLNCNWKENYLQQKIDPPRELKPRIFSEIGMEKDEQPPRIPLAKPTLVPRAGFAKYVAAASLILLAGSVLLNLYLLDQYKKSIAQYKELSAIQTQVAGTNQVLQTKLDNYESALNLMKNPLMAIVKMPGSPNSPAPSSMATVYWNTESKDVYLLVNQLPKPVAGKQYQLWAIVDGKPVDAGIFELGEGISFVKLKNDTQSRCVCHNAGKNGRQYNSHHGSNVCDGKGYRLATYLRFQCKCPKDFTVYSPIVFPLLTWTLFIFILLALPGKMLPNESHFTIPQLDKLVHIILFGSFVFLWSFYFSTKGREYKPEWKIFDESRSLPVFMDMPWS